MKVSPRRRDALLIFFTLLLAYIYVLPRWADWSQNSRLNLVRALVEQRTTRIDAYVANTGDYALFNGHTYTDKPPGLSFVALPFYAAASPIIEHPAVLPLLAKVAGGGAMSGTLNPIGTGLNVDKIRHFVAQALLTAITVAIPAAGLGVLLYYVLAWLGMARPINLAVTLGYGLATPAAAYAGNFYSHQFVAALLFGACALLVQATVKQNATGAQGRMLPFSAPSAFLFGLLCSFALISEYPVALIIAALGVYALYRMRPVMLGLAILGGLPPIALMVAYNLAAFGTPMPVGYSHSALWQDQHHTGFMSITYPHAEALWGLTFGTFRGLFIRAPWLLLAIPGFVIWWRLREWRGLWAICLAATTALTLFYGSSAMWWGGFGVGPRYLVPMLPFLALPAAYGMRALWSSFRGRALASSLLVFSAVLTWSETLAGQSFPSDGIRQPWLSYTLTAWFNNDIARSLGTAIGLDGAISIVPLLVLLVAMVGLIFMPGSENEPQPATAGTPVTLQQS